MSTTIPIKAYGDEKCGARLHEDVFEVDCLYLDFDGVDFTTDVSGNRRHLSIKWPLGMAKALGLVDSTYEVKCWDRE